MTIVILVLLNISTMKCILWSLNVCTLHSGANVKINIIYSWPMIHLYVWNIKDKCIPYGVESLFIMIPYHCICKLSVFVIPMHAHWNQDGRSNEQRNVQWQPISDEYNMASQFTWSYSSCYYINIIAYIKLHIYFIKIE